MEIATRSSSSCSNPPFQQTYKFLSEEQLQQDHLAALSPSQLAAYDDAQIELPTIDLGPLINGGDSDKVAKCKKDIAKASAEWGFFQVVNHGISGHVLKKLRLEADKLFDKPFEEKKALMGESNGISYQWGAPKATSINQLSWTEVFRIPISYFFTDDETSTRDNFWSLEQYARKATDLASTLFKVLADEIERDSMFFDQNCNPGMTFMLLNKYPPCPISSNVHGKRPHTDVDLITILYQDHVGGLQVLRDEKWINVKPNPDTLIVNIGDLLQMWSNDAYKSAKHRVMTNNQVERYSVAYFLAPTRETLIESNGKQPGIYKLFTYGEYIDQVADYIRKHGDKPGLNRYLASQNN